MCEYHRSDTTMIKTFKLDTRADTSSLKLPKELFLYSRDIDGQWQTDDAKAKDEALPYYYFPDSYIDRNFNLGDGINKFKKIPEAENTAEFAPLLLAIKQYEQQTGKKTKVDIITFRGVMTKLLTLPYDTKTPIHLYVIGYDGQLFIKADSEYELRQREEEKEQLKASNPEKAKYNEICEYSGYKFEALTTLPKPWLQCSRSMIQKRGKKAVNNYEQYISVVRSGIGKTKTLLAGEVDCVWDYLPNEEEGKNEPVKHYMELKTSAMVDNPQKAVNFERKLFKTWAQCFLLGIPKILYGFRDRNHILKNVEMYTTEEIPLMIKNSEYPRGTEQRFNCVDALKCYGALLEWIKSNVDANDELKAFKIVYDSGSRTFSLNECMGDENKRLRNGELLTEDFKAWREQLR